MKPLERIWVFGEQGVRCMHGRTRRERWYHNLF